MDMTPMAVSNQWHSDDIHRQRQISAQHDFSLPPPSHHYPPEPQQLPPSTRPLESPMVPRNPAYPRMRTPAALEAPRPAPIPTSALGGPARLEARAESFVAPPTPSFPSMPPSPTTYDSRPPFRNNDPRNSARSERRPPAILQNPAGPATGPRWDSMSASGSPTAMRSPTSPRFNAHGAAAPPYPYQGQLRSAPPTPSSYDGSSRTSDGYHGPPPRPLRGKLSFPEMRTQMQAQDSRGSGVGNFSRPRKQSLVQPASENFSRTRPPLLPTPSEDGPEMFHNPLPSPFPRARRPSISSNYSASTWAPGLSPTNSEFPDQRSSGPRPRHHGPPPVSANRPQFGYNNRIDSTGSAPAMSGPAPWVNGDELRSSFRSQLTASSAPGTANTERSSILTKESSTTSLDAHHEGDMDEPSLEDVMGMYEDGFEDDGEDDIEDSRPAVIVSEERPRSPELASSHDRTSSHVDTDLADNHHLSPPQLPAARIDAEIRQSKLFFSSPAFMASVPHLASSIDRADEDKEIEKRDSGKSLESDPSEVSQPTVTSPHQSTGPSSHLSTSDAITRDTPSPTTNDHVRDGDIFPSPTPSYQAGSGFAENISPPEMPAEKEEPGSRDRYGFKKETQHITKKQYDKWDKNYSEYLVRRKKKWQAFLKENALMTDNPNRFPAPGVKTKKFVRKGIPPEWRGAAWFYYAGGPAILAKHGGLYSKMLQQKAKRIDVEAIERDLHRTFPDNINFKPPGTSTTDAGNHKIIDANDTVQPKPEEPPIISSLRRVLFAFSIYNPDIGYCQSLNFIAGLLLLFVDTEEQCFWLRNVITRIYPPLTYEMSLEGSKVDLSVLMTEIRDTMPAVWDKIGGELEAQPNSRPSTSRSLRRPKFRRREQGSLSTERLPPITLCMTAWFMSCFIGTLPIETTLRVWDVFFYEGSKTLFRVALAIFKSGESEIMAVSDPMEMFGVVQTMPRKMIDANGLIDACFKRRNGFGHLSQGAIDERRQERRQKAQQGKDASGRGKTTASGNVTEGETEVRRKGTLFRRKKRDPSKPRPAEV